MKSLFWNVGLSLVFLLQFTGLLVLLQPRGVAGTGDNSTCPVTQFQCADGNCIPISWKCDIDSDCEDHSDETHCPSTTCAEDEFKCANGKCIPLRWTCDKDPDCSDNSDEDMENLCKVRTCSTDQFACESGVCISGKWRCDGTSDCKETDGEDEKDCPSTCQGDMFKCESGQCIASRWRCDFDNDCKDGSDEKDCPPPPTSCKTEEFQCHDGACIKHEWVCDGDFDCNDKSDEKTCENGTVNHCTNNQFQCKTSGECIHNSWFCDNDADCEDESDEACNITCRADQFLCTEDRYCLSNSVKCDGSEDCTDGTDEANCTNTTPSSGCKQDQFDCGGGRCISRELVCDGNNDCPNMNDEGQELGCKNDLCKINNGHCDQKCVNLFRNKRRCDCNEGYALMNGSTTVCDDIDECKDNHIHGACSQICKNTKGSFKCECVEGYFLVNNRYCKAVGEGPELLLADRKDLRKIHLETYNYKLILDESKVHAAIAMDYHFDEKQFYWTDVKLESIFRANFDDNSSVEILVNNTDTPDGLAVDWINNHIYWTDTGYNKIEVASLDGKMRKTLIDDHLDEPRAIVLDPNNGYVYWTDWGENPKIERCGLNGENREVIVDKEITWPNGLTIDYAASRLYWIDAKRHTIESSDLNGQRRATVLKSHLHLNHPFAITVFEDFLYWTDWPSESVRKFSKFGHGEVETIALNLHSPMDVHVLHPYRQKKTQRGQEFCGTDNGGCSHFCLPKALSDPANYKSGDKHYTCACPNGYGLLADGKMCKEGENSTGVTPRPANTPAPHKPDSPNNSHNVAKVPKPVITTTEKPKVVEISTEGNGGYTVMHHNLTKSETPQHMSEENVGQIAGIVIGVLLALILIGAVVCFILYRKYSRNHGKSMNFDNPVYRKTTTEEGLIIEKNRSNLPSSMQPLTQPLPHEIV